MKILLKIVSFIGLALTLLPSFFVACGKIEFQTHSTLMLVGMLMWFSTAPFWIGKDKA